MPLHKSLLIASAAGERAGGGGEEMKERGTSRLRHVGAGAFCEWTQ